MGFRDAMNPFQKPDLSSAGAGARSGARLGSAFGPIGLGLGAGIGALAGWIRSRSSTDAPQGAAAWQGAPMAQFAGSQSDAPFQGFGDGIDPGSPDNIGDALGITDYSQGPGSEGGYEMRDSGSIMPTGNQSLGYSAAGGGFGGGLWEGGGGMRSYAVNGPSLTPSNYQGIDSGQGRKKGTGPRT